MKNSKAKIIKEIAQELDCGNTCYYNSKTNKIIAIPDFSTFPDEEEFRIHFETELESVETQKADLIKINKIESVASFQIMKQFINEVTDSHFKLELENALQKKKPFQNFKFLIDN